MYKQNNKTIEFKCRLKRVYIFLLFNQSRLAADRFQTDLKRERRTIIGFLEQS